MDGSTGLSVGSTDANTVEPALYIEGTYPHDIRTTHEPPVCIGVGLVDDPPSSGVVVATNDPTDISSDGVSVGPNIEVVAPYPPSSGEVEDDVTTNLEELVSGLTSKQ